MKIILQNILKKNGKPDFRRKQIKEILELIHQKELKAEKEKNNK